LCFTILHPICNLFTYFFKWRIYHFWFWVHEGCNWIVIFVFGTTESSFLFNFTLSFFSSEAISIWPIFIITWTSLNYGSLSKSCFSGTITEWLFTFGSLSKNYSRWRSAFDCVILHFWPYVLVLFRLFIEISPP
jgi:hypothetical protein